MGGVVARRTAGVVVVVVLLAALAAVAGERRAGAQPATEVHVISNLAVFANNGVSSLPEFSGSADGVDGVECGGASPLGGTPNIPTGVVAQLQTATTRLRIFRPDGHALTGTVRVNCTLEVETGSVAAAKL